MLNQQLQQKLLQKLSPQQIQFIKLLEIPAVQLEDRIEKELMENPLLEEGSDGDSGENDDTGEDTSQKEEKNDTGDLSIDEYLADDTPLYKLSTKNSGKEEQRVEIPFSVAGSFHEQLVAQLGLRDITGRRLILAEYLIGNIDDDGYLRRRLGSVADDMAFSMGIETTEKELEDVLKVIQEFDPPGIGARDLQECLMLQLNQKEETDEINMAKVILTDYFDEFTKKHYDKITAPRSGITEEDLKGAVAEILKLNPKPGGSFLSDKVAEHIVPDFLLENKDGTLQLSLNSRNIPELRISRTYSDMLDTYRKNKNKKNRETAKFVKQKLDAAKWFIDAIKQRQSTLMQTMEAIINYQREYFLSGGNELLLNPMILKDIADATTLDISTVSRVANSKYVQTPFGILPLKFFFSEGLQTDWGEEVSTHEIKKILQECVDGESKRKPLKDDELVAVLQKKGYLIARRTIAKYREQMNIPVARMRRQL